MKSGYRPPLSTTLDFSLSGGHNTITSDVVFKYDADTIDFTGLGTLSGQLMDRSVAKSGIVKIYYRANPTIPFSQWELVREVQTEIDGTWIVTGLNENYEYDVVASMNGWFDRVITKVKPKV